MRLRLSWPTASSIVDRETFFLGAFRAAGPLEVAVDPAPSGFSIAREGGEHWILLSNRSPRHEGAPGLVHRSGESGGLAFRGYVVDPPVHSWSPESEVAGLWDDVLCGRPNGVFAAARVSGAVPSLRLITDAFGMGSVYWRRLDDVILFATNPRFLKGPDDHPDLLSWRTRIAWEVPLGDRTLSEEIRRVPPGTVLHFGTDGMREVAWYDFASLPGPRRELDEHVVEEVEEAFQVAMDRTLALDGFGNTLLLSGGRDSRRILGALRARDAQFACLTARVPGEDSRDLDAHVASLLAEGLGFDHRIIEPRMGARGLEADRERRLLFDAETPLHEWAVSLIGALPASPVRVFDGLGGDVLGETGFEYEFRRKPGLVPPDASEAAKVDAATVLIADPLLDPILNARVWPSAAEVRSEIGGWISRLDSPAWSDLGFLLLRTRRAIAPAWQALMPSGHVSVYPYLDLDYVELLLGISLDGRVGHSIQATCLARYAPELDAYPSSRSLRSGVPVLPKRPFERQALARIRALEAGLQATAGAPSVEALLSAPYRHRYGLARRSGRLALRWRWWIEPLLELAERQTQPVVWTRLP